MFLRGILKGICGSLKIIKISSIMGLVNVSLQQGARYQCLADAVNP